MKRNSEVDAYLGKVQPFALPILEHLRSETRAKRVAAAVEWIAEGKQCNWKYQQA